MNPLTNVRNTQNLNKRELELGLTGTGSSWHADFKDSAWIFIGGLPYDLTEGDVITIFSQYGEIVNLNLVRDRQTGKSKGFCFLCYEDQRSTILAVDNLNSIKILNRTLRVNHVADYKMPKEHGDEDELTLHLRDEGCAPKIQESEPEEETQLPVKKPKKEKKKKKKKEKKKKKSKKGLSDTDSEGDSSSTETHSGHGQRNKSLPSKGHSKVKIEKIDPVYDKSANNTVKKRRNEDYDSDSSSRFEGESEKRHRKRESGSYDSPSHSVDYTKDYRVKREPCVDTRGSRDVSKHRGREYGGESEDDSCERPGRRTKDRGSSGREQHRDLHREDRRVRQGGEPRRAGEREKRDSFQHKHDKDSDRRRDSDEIVKHRVEIEREYYEKSDRVQERNKPKRRSSRDPSWEKEESHRGRSERSRDRETRDRQRRDKRNSRERFTERSRGRDGSRGRDRNRSRERSEERDSKRDWSRDRDRRSHRSDYESHRSKEKMKIVVEIHK